MYVIILIGLNQCLLHILHPHILIEIFMDPCIFPFTYNDVAYHRCTAVHSDFDWCSLDSIFQGRWRYCTATDPPMCVFPFTFRKSTFKNCTKESFVLNRSWCSLTSDYNKDRKWKQCSPLQ
uniref:Fibronectin type-II domain-containing protein n=1 Tax=Sciurus vulgaris TaxID=55149 RepID=A0A8D2D1W1_SCIVU